jgi:hypothetical protein
MDAVATHKTDDSIASTILDISSWVTATLDAPVDAAFFSHTLTTLVRRQQLGQVVELLEGMRLRHDIPHLDPSTTTEVLTLLRDAVRESLLHGPPSGSDGTLVNSNSRSRRCYPNRCFLEPSVGVLEQEGRELRDQDEQLMTREANGDLERRSASGRQE